MHGRSGKHEVRSETTGPNRFVRGKKRMRVSPPTLPATPLWRVDWLRPPRVPIPHHTSGRHHIGARHYNCPCFRRPLESPLERIQVVNLLCFVDSFFRDKISRSNPFTHYIRIPTTIGVASTYTTGWSNAMHAPSSTIHGKSSRRKTGKQHQ